MKMLYALGCYFDRICDSLKYFIFVMVLPYLQRIYTTGPRVLKKMTYKTVVALLVLFEMTGLA